jgi:predicted enzyme related to lactoylglutathione lyase
VADERGRGGDLLAPGERGGCGTGSGPGAWDLAGIGRAQFEGAVGDVDADRIVEAAADELGAGDERRSEVPSRLDQRSAAERRRSPRRLEAVPGQRTVLTDLADLEFEDPATVDDATPGRGEPVEYRSAGSFALCASRRRLECMAIAKQPVVVLDAPDAAELGQFYGKLLDWKVAVDEDGTWAEVTSDSWPPICIQQVEDYHAPSWPSQDHPQQMHLDVIVEDLEAAEAAVIEIGAGKAAEQPGETFRVFLDPAGHPFCLCRA